MGRIEDPGGRSAASDPGETEAYLAELYRSLEEERADLRERVKELRRIFTLDRLLRDAVDNWDAALQSVVEAIPPGFQLPEQTEARLELGGDSGSTPGFRDSEHGISTGVDGGNGRAGRIEVRLIGDPRDPGRLPFIPEEDDLLAALAHRIGEAWRRREQSSRLRLLDTALHAAAHSVVITDRDGFIEWANPAFTRVTGYTLDEALGTTPGELIGTGTHDKPFYEELWRTILSGEVWPGRMLNRTRGGALYPEQLTITPVMASTGEITHFVAMKVDLSEREAAAEEQARLRAVIEGVPQLVGMADLQGRTLYINEAGREMIGVSTNEDIIGRPFATFHPAWAAEKLGTAGFPQAVEKGFWEGETALLGPDGEEFPTWQQVRVHRTPSGEAEFLSTMIRDLREEKQRSARPQLQAALLEAVAQAVVATEPDGRVIYWNRGAEELFGWSAEEMIGRIARKLILPEEEQARAEEVRALLAGGEIRSGDLVIRRKDGSRRTTSRKILPWTKTWVRC